MKNVIFTDDLVGRFYLAKERIAAIPDEMREAPNTDIQYPDFFMSGAKLINYILSSYNLVSIEDISSADMSVLAERNDKTYASILPSNYGSSYANPDFADEKLGLYGGVLSFVYSELYIIPSILYGKEEIDNTNVTEITEVIYLLELFLLLYGMFSYGETPLLSHVEEAVSMYAHDYIAEVAENRIFENMLPDTQSVASEIIYHADLTNPNYLYAYGEYISETEIKLSKYLASLSDERISDIAHTFTDGFRRGFDVMGVSFEGKTAVNIRYHIGQERIVRAATKDFAAMGLEVILSKSIVSRLVRRGVVRTGYESTSPNKQFEFDHRLDDRFFLDKGFVEKRLDGTRAAYKELGEEVSKYAGPAVIESFGEELFVPVVKDTVEGYTEEQEGLNREMYGRLGELSNEYLPGDSYSFTIIAFPLPDIGDKFEEIFDETILINTLDNEKYKRIQQTIIDTLDKASQARVVGMNGNQTDISVSLRILEHPEKETQFENCTADVNIPLGEVFTSPVLKGTKGRLNVKSAYLNGYNFQNLTIDFEDGVVKDYTCDGHDSDEAAKRYIKENILFNHEFLPIGEFAIGTNTTAYSMAEKYDILKLLPILIVEKTGPHFALGDTCYSHAEDHKVYNPDGKEIISRENEFAALRNTEPEKAYFNCHTDITIPYNELGRLTAITPEGVETDIILNGRFVLPGTEELNEAL